MDSPYTESDIYINGHLRLGRVEVCIDDFYGTICDDSSWNDADASVICKQLGFSPYGNIKVFIC